MEPTHLLCTRGKFDADDWAPELDGGEGFIVAHVTIDPESNAVSFSTDEKMSLLLHDEFEYAWRTMTPELRAQHEAKQKAESAEVDALFRRYEAERPPNSIERPLGRHEK
ncbi:hypothetical protein P0R31_37090 [Bradyrhizobium yuanmingense]|uniref:hypothetical protein n=1 Tax=Bradyrhizobium yuanmingense TaxID=108015 RepID=UPI0023B9743E|nr:hypothetical protein [Bradyrhizobium yuanmingense]MDF0522855.1 hypothetical protein [Bradyrhizobium yuanmingense]